MSAVSRQLLHAPGEVVVVPMGEYYVAAAPCSLVTKNLGSCVGIAIYSPQRRAGGLIHIAFPDSGIGTIQPAAHADVAIRAVVQRLEAMGAARMLLQVYLAGGGNMFGFAPTPQMDIGARNVECVRRVLAEELLRARAEDVKLDHPRTMALDLCNGRVLLSTSGKVYRVMGGRQASTDPGVMAVV